jgi:predicted lipoprotein with Yx(FWY)xxD motif
MGSSGSSARRPRPARRTAVAGAALALLLAGCASSPSARDPLLMIKVPDSVQVRSGSVAGLGTIITDSTGHTLYMFPPDAGSVVRCTGACAGTWPPLVIARGHRPTAGGGVQAGDLGTLPDPNTGGLVVTYGGYPLYRYAGDLSAGVANGQALFSDGGPWYALSPQAQPITAQPSGTAS